MLKVAAVQVAASADAEQNLKKAAQYLEVAAERGAALACLPELFALPWFPREADADVFPLAQPADGELAGSVQELAGRLGIAVVCPFFERARDGVYHNSALVVDSDGRRAGVYRKVHVPDIPHWHEKRYFAPGDRGFPVFEVAGCRVGVQLGWDNFFPEGFRCLALAGAQLVCVPTAAAFASQERWLAMGVGHAVANGLHLLRVNRVGGEPGLDFYGHSFCVRPDGDLASEPLGVGEGILMVDLDLGAVERARRMWPFFQDRRPRQYLRVAGIDLDACAAAPEEPLEPVPGAAAGCRGAPPRERP